MKQNPPAKLIIGQVVYMGPRIPAIGLGYSQTFRDGIYPHYYEWIARCPSIGAMFVPPSQVALVRRELNFDYAHNMRGTAGKFVTFYREIQRWISQQTQAKQPAQPGITVKQKSNA
jgi:hypothetical protein